jgi:predicted phosphodiesterase
LELLQHYSDKEVQEMLNYVANNTKREIDEVIWEPWHLKFALVSDTHFGSKAAAKDELWEFYDIAKDRWVECFVHCGDLVDWCGVYKLQQFEQSWVWFTDQRTDVKDNYPNVWLPTYFIAWNHDENFLKANGVNICKAVEQVRQDLVNLWFYDARLKLNGIDINLHHGGGSLSYAKDYKMKKYLDSLPVEWQPDIFALGHYHTALYDLHRWIHWFMPWSFMKENLLAKRFNLGNTIWGWIIEIEKDKNGKSRLNMEYVKF